MGHETILVTGGSRGIGRAVVAALVRDGAHVAFTYRTGEEEARQIEADSRGLAKAFALDLGDPERPGLLVTEVETLLGPIVGLVNNAGIRKEALLALMSDDDWNAVLDTNLGGLFRCCRAVMRGMVLRRRGSIVNVASISAVHGLPGQAAYAASKAGVLGLTRSLAREIGKRNIRVNAVVPGFVPTDLTADLKPAQLEALRATECLPGGVTVESVAETIVFLLSERSSSITGQALVVDAGSTA